MCGQRTAWLACALACALGGCGTIGNLSDPNQTKPFGGVMRDANASGWLMNEASQASQKPAAEVAGLVLAAPIVTIDLPLSIVGDTVTLPITIPMALLRGGQTEPPPGQVSAAPPASTSPMNPSAAPVPVSCYMPSVAAPGAGQR